jgi:hypothetical protein
MLKDNKTKMFFEVGGSREDEYKNITVFGYEVVMCECENFKQGAI